MLKRKIIELLRWLLYTLNDSEYMEFGSEIVGIQLFQEHIVVATKRAVFSSENLGNGYARFKEIGVNKGEK